MKTNFHTHNYRCGHAVGNVEDYVKVAINEGYSELGISDHAPVPSYYEDRMKMEELGEYLLEIGEAQKKYEDKIKIYKSLEIEYFPEWQEYYDELKKKLDYIILGLHAFRIEGESKIYNAWNIKEEKHVLAYGKYMVNYRNWTENCIEAAHIICKAAEKYNVPLEVNANGIRKTLVRHPDWDRYMYPYKEFWEIAAKYNICTIIGSDAHDFMEMEDEAMEIARKFAKELGLNIIESIF